MAFRQVLVTQPRNADAWLHLGLALDALNEAGGAVDAFRHALDLSPGLAAAVGPLTMLLVAETEQEAIERLHRAAAANSGSLARHIPHAKALMLAAKDTEAERELQRVLAVSPGNSDAIMTLGIIHNRNGRFDEARKSFRRVIDLEPKQSSAYFALFNITKATETDRPLLERIGGMVRSGRFSDPSLLRLLFALGKGHDDLNEPEAAMQAFDKANCIRGRLYPLDRAAYQENADWLDALLHRPENGHAWLGTARRKSSRSS